ncbi:hypothetical protein [Paludibacterium paludis]|uniref:hypothetical protein n=1 Tax=Paludibacterium paludis TaxID=1225769 RepID=UPI001671F1C5|nr:hypothetical protein [Paludibacterium paludis]
MASLFHFQPRHAVSDVLDDTRQSVLLPLFDRFFASFRQTACPDGDPVLADRLWHDQRWRLGRGT